jgi:hypothetical protein
MGGTNKMNTTENKTESEEKPWYMYYQQREYRGVKYNIYTITPQGVEEKIKAFIDKILSQQLYQMNIEDCQIITEGSEAVLFDVWFFKHEMITQREITPQKKPDFMISRHKNKNNKKYGYRIRYGL